MTPTTELAHSIPESWQVGFHPEDDLLTPSQLAADPGALIEVAYAEYCDRRDAGEAVDRDEFLARFPDCRAALRELLSVDRKLGEDPTILDQLDDWPQIGEVIADCHILRELGRGNFSRVYLAIELTTERPVAFKVSRMATTEGRTLGRLHNDLIAPVLWARQEGPGRNYVCMPFLGGATLDSVLNRIFPRVGDQPPRDADVLLAAIDSLVQPDDPAPAWEVAGPSLRGLSFPRGVAQLGSRLASALAYLHGRGHAHHDLKPSNVLLTPSGQPLLLDFNLSRGESDNNGIFGGTPAYMAPEQVNAFLRGKPLGEREAARSDVYSLGVMLYELLTGVHPFGSPRDNDPVAAVESMRILHQRGYTALRRREPRIPARLATLVERCMAADPARRPTAAQLADLLADRPVRWPRLATAAACVLASGMSLGAWAVGPFRTDARTLRQRGLSEVKTARTLLAHNETRKAEKHLRAAETAFGSAIDEQLRQGGQPVVWSDYFERGRVRLLLGDRAAALDYFQQADKGYRETQHPAALATALFGNGPGLQSLALAPRLSQGNRDGRTLAYLAYTHALLGKHDLAIALGQEARDWGFANAAVLNNLGYTHFKRRNEVDLEEAATCFEQALTQDRSLPAVFHNRAQLAYRQAQRSPARLSPQAAEDIDNAIALSTRSGLTEPASLYRLGVLIHLAAGEQMKDKPEATQHRERAARYLERACVLGLDPTPMLKLDVKLEPLCKQSALDAGKLSALRKQDQVPAAWTHLVEPVGD